MTISVVMIVKNEEEMLARCLESVKEADSIVIVDTGSEDKTVEIAKKYTDKIFYFKWCDSFCKARNFAKSKATGDWILSIDADERLLNPLEDVREAIKGAEAEGRNFVDVKVKAEGYDSSNLFPRIYKNIPSIKWHGAAHNYLEEQGSKPKGNYRSDITIEYGNSPAHKLDPNRTFRILRNAVEKDPSLMRERFYLAREFYYKKNYRMCVEHLERYVKGSSFVGERAEAYLMMARCKWFLKEGEQARRACMQAIFTNPDFKEALVFMSEMNYEPRKSIWLKYSELAQNRNVLFTRNPVEKSSSYYDELFKKSTDFSRYTNIYEKIGEIVGKKNALDIGCGPATLSDYIKNYGGFDFAEETIKGIEGDVWVGNALDEDNYRDADVYIATEVLEHIMEDRKVFENIPSGKSFIVSVPSFSDPSHVRTFTKEMFLLRYKGLIEVEEIYKYIWLNGKWVLGKQKNLPYILLVVGKKI